MWDFYLHLFCQCKLAQWLGFKPMCDYPKLISNQPRYDHFDTAAFYF